MDNIVQCLDKIYKIDKIIKVFEKSIEQRVRSVHRYENVTNNSVYRIDTELQSYIFKIYKSGWPEDGKLLFIEKKLTEHNIPHAKIFVYNRANTEFTNGYLIEECLPGTTADRLALSKNQTIDLFIKLGALVSQIHKIELKGYGYIGGGVADWSKFSDFMYNSFHENTNNLLAQNLIKRDEVETIWSEIYQGLKACDKYPPVLCHTDLSTKNVLINENRLTLIDWDDAYALCWVADIAHLTLWMKHEYGNNAAVYRKAFLDNYKTEHDMKVFYEVEDLLHVRYCLENINYFIGTPQYDSFKTILKDSLEKCGMRLESLL
jgi:Ser/Thr protein kinase RdoA (MazF antagonist)